MARKARELTSTGIYHVMLRGINRQTIFEDDEDFRRFKKILYDMVHPLDEVTGRPLSARCHFYAYCLMSNHVHLLFHEQSDSLAESIKRIAVSYAQYYNKKYVRYGHLFQDRFRSEPVNDGSYFFTLIQYIHQNPVASGISSSVSEYGWSSWGEYESAGSGIPTICSTTPVLARMDKEKLRELVNTMLPATQSILDFDSGHKMKTDEEVKEFLSNRYAISHPVDLQLLSRDRQNDIIRDTLQFGATLRQLVRLTGLSYSIIRRA